MSSDKSLQVREEEVSRLQSQLLLQLKAAQCIPSDAFQTAFQEMCRKFVQTGEEVRQTFDLSGFSRNIRVWLNRSRQSMIQLVKK